MATASPAPSPPPRSLLATPTYSPLFLVGTTDGASAPARVVDVNADASRLLAMRDDGLAAMWDLRTARLISTLERTAGDQPTSDEAPDRPQFELDTTGTRAFAHMTHPGTHSWNFGHEVRVWNVRTGRLESSRTIVASTFASRPSADGAMRAFLANGYYLDAGSALHVEGAPAIASALRRERDRELVLDVRWSEDGTRFAVLRLASPPGPGERATTSILDVWVVGSGRRLVTVPAPGDHLAAFSHDGSTVAVGVWHASTSVFDVATTTWHPTIAHDGLAATISGDGDTLATEPSVDDPTVSVYATRSAAKIATIANARLGGAVALDRQGRRLAVVTENDVTVWDVASPSKPVLRFAATDGGPGAFTRDGRCVVATDGESLDIHRVSDGAWVEARPFFAAGAKGAPTLVVRTSASMAKLADFW